MAIKQKPFLSDDDIETMFNGIGKRSSTYYVLDGKIPVPATMFEASKFMGSRDRNLWVTELIKEEIGISTVFIGLNTRPMGSIALFESMIFGGEFDLFQLKYVTWDEAMAGHALLKKLVRASLGKKTASESDLH